MQAFSLQRPNKILFYVGKTLELPTIFLVLECPKADYPERSKGTYTVRAEDVI